MTGFGVSSFPGRANDRDSFAWSRFPTPRFLQQRQSCPKASKNVKWCQASHLHTQTLVSPNDRLKMLFLFPIFFVRRRLTIPLSCTSYFGPEWVDWGMNIISQKKSWKIPQNTKLHWNNHKYLNLFWVHGIWITWRMKNQDSPKLEKCIHDTQKRIFDSSSTFDNLFFEEKTTHEVCIHMYMHINI